MGFGPKPFTVVPGSPEHDLLWGLLDTSASRWSERTSGRRQQFFTGERVWVTAGYQKRYEGVLGGTTTRQVIRKNAEA